MSSKKFQELFNLLELDQDFSTFVRKLIDFFTKFPYLTFTFLIRELGQDSMEISELLRPLNKSNLIKFEFELECPKCFNDIISVDSPDKLLGKEIECRYESCRYRFLPEKDDILIKIYKSDYWDGFVTEFFRLSRIHHKSSLIVSQYEDETLGSLMELGTNTYKKFEKEYKQQLIEYECSIAFSGLEGTLIVRKEYPIVITGKINQKVRKILFKLVDDQGQTHFQHWHVDYIDTYFVLENLIEQVKFNEINYYRLRMYIIKDLSIIAESKPIKVKVIKVLSLKERLLTPISFLWGCFEPIVFILAIILDSIAIFVKCSLFRVIIYSITIGIIIGVYLVRVFTKKVIEPDKN